MDKLERFHPMHAMSFETALAEIRVGYKVSHWMWYIFPQIAGLGQSSTARYYSIRDLEEATLSIQGETRFPAA